MGFTRIDQIALNFLSRYSHVSWIFRLLLQAKRRLLLLRTLLLLLRAKLRLLLCSYACFFYPRCIFYCHVICSAYRRFQKENPKGKSAPFWKKGSKLPSKNTGGKTECPKMTAEMPGTLLMLASNASFMSKRPKISKSPPKKTEPVVLLCGLKVLHLGVQWRHCAAECGRDRFIRRNRSQIKDRTSSRLINN